MKAVVDTTLCVGCGLCCSTAPELFRMTDGGTAEGYAEVTDANSADVEEAADSCPVAAIRIEA